MISITPGQDFAACKGPMRDPALRRERVVTRYVPGVAPGRVPPHDLDAEAAVLSAILLSQEALDRVLEILKPEHFYSDANGRKALLKFTASYARFDNLATGDYSEVDDG